MVVIAKNLSQNEYYVLIEIWMFGGRMKIGNLMNNLTEKYGKTRSTWYTYLHRLEDKNLIRLPKRNYIETTICYSDFTCEYIDHLFNDILQLGIDDSTEEIIRRNLSKFGYNLSKNL